MFLPEPTYVLSHIQEQWHVPVVRCQHPGSAFVVMATDTAQGFERVAPLSMFALGSAFKDNMPGPLRDLQKEGWAFVQAWPLNIPGFNEHCPGYHTEQYALCVLRFHRLWAAAQGAQAPEATAMVEAHRRGEGVSVYA